MAKAKGKPDLDSPEAVRVRELLESVVKDRFDGNETAAATELGVSQPTVNFVLNKKRGAGLELLDGLATVTGRPVDNIRGRVPRFCELPGWAEALPEARRMFRQIPPAAFEAVGNLMGRAPPGEISPAVIGQLAQGWYASASDETRIAARRARAEVDAAAEDAEADNDNELLRAIKS